jgi:hypothetical protein
MVFVAFSPSMSPACGDAVGSQHCMPYYLAREIMHIDGISGDAPPPESIAA